MENPGKFLRRRVGGTGQRKASGKTSSPGSPPAEELATLQAPPSLQPLGNHKDPVDIWGESRLALLTPYPPVRWLEAIRHPLSTLQVTRGPHRR